MNRKIICFILVLMGFAIDSFAQKDQELRSAIAELLTKQKLSGAVWATVSEEGEIETGASGYKNAESKLLLSPSDRVHVGSVSKAILAAGILRLATLELITLDDPIRFYLPTLPLSNRWDETNPVTIRHLLDHTSGLTDARLWHVFSTTATPDTPLEAVYKADTTVLRTHAKPGSVYSYSNLGYTILGMVIEKITHDRYEQFLDENLLKPLGMVNSTFKFVTQEGAHADGRLASGHLDDGQPVFARPGYLRPAGQFTTTAGDMGIFLRFMMSEGKIYGMPFIESEFLRSVGDQRRTDAFRNGVPYGDALGAYSRDRYGVIGIAKNGNILGFTSMTYMFPDHDKAFFISYNMDSETADYDLFNRLLARHLDIPARKMITTKQATEDTLQQWRGYYMPVITKVEPFALIDKVFSHTKVTVVSDGAILEPMQGTKRELLYQGRKLFSMADRTNISHAFYKNENGELLITDGIRTIKKVSGFTIAAIAISFLLGLSGMGYVIISSTVRLVSLKSVPKYRPIYLTYFNLLIVLISLLVIANQQFIQLGDKTFGSMLLAVGSGLLPLMSTVSLIQSIRRRMGNWQIVDCCAIIFILQFVFLLMANELLPIVMWR